jgi:hypothetical protein
VQDTTLALDTETPTVPIGLTATPISSSQIDLTWNASTDNVGVTGYKIYRDSVEIDTSSTTSYSDTGLNSETAYTYTVSAYDAAGNESGQSNFSSATTSIAPPPTVSLANSGTMISNSQIFASNAPIEGLWDGIMDINAQGLQTGSAGSANIASFWVEFDFGQNYDLTSAQLFGDAKGSWVSNTWEFKFKQDISDPWNTAFSNINVFFNGWSTQDIFNIVTRYVRVEVYGASSTQAWELEIYGTPGSGDSNPPSPPFGLMIQ